MTLPEVRQRLRKRLEARREEMERAIRARIDGISDPTDPSDDPIYAQRLRAAVSIALDYGLATIEVEEERAPPPPPELLFQARIAARARVSLDTVLRRYFAGYMTLGDFLIREIEDDRRVSRTALQHVMRAHANLFDRLVSAVTEEYSREAEGLVGSTEGRRAERLRRLLAGELLDVSGLAYEFDAWHLGAIAAGSGALEAIRRLATRIDRRLISMRDGDGPVWAWFGGRHKVDLDVLERLLAHEWPSGVALALGEPAHGLAGWRLTHRQAQAALLVALRGRNRVTRYANVALLASMLQDDLLATSLQSLYLRPFESERDGGKVLQKTLRAYFAADRNVSSAAAALGVNRNTVASRLRAVETTIGRSLASCAPELAAVLRLTELSESTGTDLASR